MQRALLNRATIRVADTTDLSGRVTAESIKHLAPMPAQTQGLAVQISDLQAQVAKLQSQVEALQTQLAALQSNSVTQLDPYVSVNPNPIDGVIGPNIIFTGANIHIRSGSGSTNDHGHPTGLGNLIIGYDETGALNPGDRGGSHNLVIGTFHKFTTHAFGGLVAGRGNEISGRAASVSGGFNNAASGDTASVSGGEGNTANGSFASVSGGFNNLAIGGAASVSGGANGYASGVVASVASAAGTVTPLAVNSAASAGVLLTPPAAAPPASAAG